MMNVFLLVLVIWSTQALAKVPEISELDQKPCVLNTYLDGQQMDKDKQTRIDSGESDEGEFVEIPAVFYLILHGITLTPDFVKTETPTQVEYRSFSKEGKDWTCDPKKKKKYKDQLYSLKITEKQIEIEYSVNCRSGLTYEKTTSKLTCAFSKP